VRGAGGPCPPGFRNAIASRCSTRGSAWRRGIGRGSFHHRATVPA
jgi:hypothetical protein